MVRDSSIDPRHFPNAGAPTGRTLPHSIEAEEMFLSSIFIDPQDVLPRAIMAGLRNGEMLYVPAHGVVYDAMLDFYAKGKPISPDTIAEDLKTRRQLDAVGGYAFIAQISTRSPTTAQAAHFIKLVKEQTSLRRLIRELTGGVEDCYGYSGDFEQFMAGMSSRLSKAVDADAAPDEETVEAVAGRLLEEINVPRAQRKDAQGEVPWGTLIDLSCSCGKLQPSTLNVLAGQPSTGKSALSDQVAWEAAEKGLVGEVLIFSYEMSKRDKVIRMAQQISRLNMDDYDDAPVDRKISFTQAVRAIKANKRLHIFERDTTTQRLQARTRAIHQKNKVGLIVVDFLQYLARMEPTIGKERSDEKIGRITAAMKSLAKECECPVLLLSSLNRDGYRDGPAKRPNMASLRASGDIESDADVVMMLHWPEKNPVTGADQDPHDSGQNFFAVSALQEKGRNKGVHEVTLAFDRRSTRFDNLHR